MPLGDREAQKEPAAADRRDRLAGEHDRAARDRHAQDDAVTRRDHLALRALLDHDLALRADGGQLVARDIHSGAQLVEPLGGCDAAIDQGLAAPEFGLSRGELRVQRAHLRVERRDLEDDLVVAHHRDPLAGGHQVALADVQLIDDPANPRAGRHRVARLDAAVDRLPFGDFRQRQIERSGPDCSRRQKRHH